MFTYRARIIRIIDGDSIVLSCDLGFRIYHTMNCRLAHINAPELNSSDELLRAKALEAKQAVIDRLIDPDVTIHSQKPFAGDKFGRYLVVIINSSGVNINQTLLDLGYAVPYEGEKR